MRTAAPDHQSLELAQFLQMPGILVDVRTPLEFTQGHIPFAHSLPLFSDEERSIVGTLYKKEGKDMAIMQGLRLVGPKLFDLIQKAKELFQQDALKIYCWRGGMRSKSLCAILNALGINTFSLKGGYKSYRRWTLATLTTSKKMIVLGGFTGSGKTEKLCQLEKAGEQVLNLERLANHRGSAFGHFGMMRQPTNEQFENEIAFLWTQFSSNKVLWVEDESRMIGCCKIPDSIFKQIKNSSLLFIECTTEERISRLCQEYASYAPELIKQALLSLTKRLGKERLERALLHLEEKNLRNLVEIVLEYYDHAYQNCLKKYSRPIIPIGPLDPLNHELYSL